MPYSKSNTGVISKKKSLVDVLRPRGDSVLGS